MRVRNALADLWAGFVVLAVGAIAQITSRCAVACRAPSRSNRFIQPTWCSGSRTGRDTVTRLGCGEAPVR